MDRLDNVLLIKVNYYHVHKFVVDVKHHILQYVKDSVDFVLLYQVVQHYLLELYAVVMVVIDQVVVQYIVLVVEW